MSLRIVVPVDGSEPCTTALTWAIAFAKRTGAELAMCSVVDPMLACIAGAGGAAIDPGPMLDTLDADAGRFCANAVASAAAQGVAVTHTVLHGMPSSAIDAFANADAADLIVLGTHARQGLSRGIFGSVTAAVVGSSSVAVVVVRAQAILDNAGPIVVAVDDSAASAAAARFAVRMALALPRAIRLIHVCAPGERPSANTQIALDMLEHEATVAGAACTIEIRHGEAVQALTDTAGDCAATLLATGTHARNAIGRLFLGSVSEGLVRDARVPILIVRDTPGAAAAA